MRILITGGSGFIGTNLIDLLLCKNYEILNIDVREPKKAGHYKYWKKCDILHTDGLKEYFKAFKPTHVVHLAARTDTNSNKLGDYLVNTEGTANVLCAAKLCDLEKLIITSTQYVYGPYGFPKDDEDYKPLLAYGESKVIAEKITRSYKELDHWTIIRPTNIWGPWHPRYPHEFWKTLRQGLYFHPGGCNPIRSYGYVGNVAFQIEKILTSDIAKVDRKTFYLGDKPIHLLEWVNGFSTAITGKRARIVPKPIIRGFALVGDLLKVAGLKPPIHSSRFKSMTEDYPVPMEPTIQAFGDPPYNLENGISKTVEWLTEQNFFTDKHAITTQTLRGN